ncbi:MAG TPA: polyprenyl synthetase family protein [Chlamydiales bacterium]|nr:polyprenyl synthetase family protein [Chlamydiales bacterium]
MLLENYRQKFEKELPLAIERFGKKSRLRDACEYALVSGGKRIRPLIVMMTADALSNGLNVLPAALGVEFFHTASLIADDLPCMDNDELRRNRLSLHKAFGEATAILASYTLIAEGYGGIYLNQEQMSQDNRFCSKASEASFLCLSAATKCAGIQGATSGQYLDLFPPDSSWKTIRKVIVQKTTTLFEISFLFGWLFGGGCTSCVKELQKLAFHLGMAFQIADDLQDDVQDGVKEMNIAMLFGRKKAISLFEKEIALFRTSLKKLHLWTEPFQELFEALHQSLCGICC